MPQGRRRKKVNRRVEARSATGDKKLDTDVANWINRIGSAHLSGDYVIADSLAQQALAETSDAPKILEIAGVIAFYRHRYDEAINQIERAMFVVPLSFTSQMVLARAFLKEDMPERSLTTIRFLVEVVERIPCEMLAELTRIASELQHFDLALSVCREACMRHPDDDQAVFGAAFYMHRLGYPVELVRNLMIKAIGLNPNSQFYRLNLASIYCSTGDWENAYDQIRRVPGEALATIPCGCMYSMLHDVLHRFNDHERLKILKTRSQETPGSVPENGSETTHD